MSADLSKIPLTSLDTTGATNGQIPKWNGSTVVWSADDNSGGGGGGGHLSRIYDVILDGGADPSTSAGREIWTQCKAGLDAGYPVYIPAGVNWTLDTATHGPLKITSGNGLFGPPGARSVISAKYRSGTTTPYNDDVIQMTGDDAFIANIHIYSALTQLVTHTTSDMTVTSSASSFTVQVTGGDIANFPASGANHIVSLSVADDESTPSIRFTYTSKTFVSGTTYNLTGCNYVYGESTMVLYQDWLIPSGTDIALFGNYGAGLRCINDSQYLNINNVEVENGYDGICWGDDSDWKTATVNMTSGSSVVTWVSGSTFSASMGATTWVSVVGAGATAVAGRILGTDSVEVSVSSRASSTQVTLTTNASATVTGAVMVWGGTAMTQGGKGGATFSSMEQFFMTNFGRYGLALFPDSDHPDLGNYKFGHGRFQSKFGDTAWLSRASGIQGTGAIKINGCNRGFDMGNGSPGTPGGSSTANFNWDVFASESHALHGIVMGDQQHPRFPCVSTIAGIQIDKIKLQLAGSVTRWPLLIDGLIQTVFLDKIYMLNTEVSAPTTAAINIRGGDEIRIGACRMKGNHAFKHLVMQSSNATNVYLDGPFMMSDASWPSADTGWWWKQSSTNDGATFDAPSSSYIDGETLGMGSRLPAMYLHSALSSAGTCTAWRFSVRQQRGFTLDVFCQFASANSTIMMHRRIMVVKHTAGGTPTSPAGAGGEFAITTPTADVGNLTAPTIGLTCATSSPISTAVVTILNNDASTITGKVWGVLRGRVVGIEAGGTGAALGGIYIG
jgi:hypothetical protein